MLCTSSGTPQDLIVAAASRPVRATDGLFDALQAAHGGALELNVLRAAPTNGQFR